LRDGSAERLRQQSGPHRRKLELHAEPDLVRLGEPDRRPTHWLGPEAREGLERDDAAVEQIEDGLELDVYLISIEDRANAGPLQLALLALELPSIEVIRHDLRQHAQEANIALVE
jgi:hypothetical protein